MHEFYLFAFHVKIQVFGIKKPHGSRSSHMVGCVYLYKFAAPANHLLQRQQPFLCWLSFLPSRHLWTLLRQVVVACLDKVPAAAPQPVEDKKTVHH
jgi:hypothetical protein